MAWALFIVGGFVLRTALYAGAACAFEWAVAGPWRAPAALRKLQPQAPAGHHRRRERLLSLSTLALFSSFSALTLVAASRGWTRLYFHVHERGWPYFFASIGIMLLLHDAYFYWMHRLLHTPFMMRHVHAWHHRSTNPTVWTALSFHPIEALFEGGIVPLSVGVLPLHPGALALWFVLMLAFNLEGHCGYELRGRRWRWPCLGLAGSAFHNLHHQKSCYNLGLYTGLWDKVCGTAAPPSKWNEKPDSGAAQPACARIFRLPAGNAPQ